MMMTIGRIGEISIDILVTGGSHYSDRLMDQDQQFIREREPVRENRGEREEKRIN